MAFRRKTGLFLAMFAAVLLASLLFVAPALFNVDRYRPRVIAYLGQKTGKQIEIGRLALSFSPLSIRIDGFGAKNPPLFPPGYIVQIARIDAVLDATGGSDCQRADQGWRSDGVESSAIRRAGPRFLGGA